jgi:hypothetical protein
VDRLTRSLADFAKLVELFDAHGVSFVSVTQAFNTTTSMGRLTLNVLLSFAQFEREVTGERIRDKVAASKRKGMRMGGPVPLGYDVNDKKLVINPEEAERVRTIFRRYLKLKSITKLIEDLRRRKIMTKQSRRSNGSVRGGIPFAKGSLAYLLRNRVYIGDIIHKGKHFTGEHPPILNPRLFQTVQEVLDAQAQSRRHARINSDSLLTGKIFDDHGNRMTPATAKKGAARYRYYVSAPLNQGTNRQAGSVARVPAPAIEAAVIKALNASGASAEAEIGGERPSDGATSIIERQLERVTIHKDRLELRVPASEGRASGTIEVSWSTPFPARKRQILLPQSATYAAQQPIRSESRARLVERIARGRYWLNKLTSGEAKDTREIANREGCSDRSVRMTLSHAFLSPLIATAAIEGKLARGLGVSALMEFPQSGTGRQRPCGPPSRQGGKGRSKPSARPGATGTAGNAKA